MSVISGKSGTIEWGGAQEAAVQNWRLTKLSENHPYHTNDSGGSRQRVAGVKDCNGTFEMLDKPTFSEGTTASLGLYTNQDIYTVTVIIDSIDVNTDVGGAIVSHAVAFSGSGTIAETTGSAP